MEKRVAVDIEGILTDSPAIPPISDTLSLLDKEVRRHEKRGIFDTQRKSWDNHIEARCDFSRHTSLQHRAGIFFHSIWKQTLFGRTLTDIKSDESMVETFSDNLASFILELFCGRLNDSWCLCTTPKRRHLTNNFSTKIGYILSEKLNIQFTEDVASCRSKQRINAIFDMVNEPARENVICFDDFVTTGSTFAAMQRLLSPTGRSILFVAGINNKL